MLAAFGHALGQGTMNNLTLGNDEFTYYETLGGGQGACADADGPSAVHVAMSNTLNTPIEALELEFPLRAVEYAIRRGSGGAGRHRGGDGVVRELEALAEMRYFADHRAPPPSRSGRGWGRSRRPGQEPDQRRRAAGQGVWHPAARRPAGERRHSEVADMAATERVAFVGSASWALRWRNLREAGFNLTVYTRTREKAERLRC